MNTFDCMSCLAVRMECSASCLTEVVCTDATEVVCTDAVVGRVPCRWRQRRYAR